MTAGWWTDVVSMAAGGCLLLVAGCATDAPSPTPAPSPLEPLTRATGLAAARAEQRMANDVSHADGTRWMPADLLTATRDDGSLVAGLSDGDATVRAVAARGLALHENPEAYEVLLARASQETEADVLVEIAFALGQRGEPVARPRLQTLLGHAEPRVRAAAAVALGKLADDRATDALVASLADADAGVRGAAALALFRLDGRRYDHTRRATEESLVARDNALAGAALHDGDPAVRWRAMYALAELRPRLGYETVLKVGLKDAEPLCRVFAARGLAALADDDQPPSDSLFALLGDQDDRVVIEALGAVAHGGDPEPLMHVAETSASGVVRGAAVTALATRMGRDDLDEAKRKALSERLAAIAQNDEAPAVRREAAATLVGGRDERRAAFFLHALADSEDARDRERAATLLAEGTLDDETVLEGLRDDEVPGVAAAALGGPYPSEADRTARLVAALASGDVALVSVAAEQVEQAATAGTADPEILRALAAALDRAAGPESKEARQVLRRALGLPDAPEREVRAPPGRLLDRLVEEHRATRSDPTPHAVLETSQGDIELELLRTEAPRHVESFLELAAAGFYDGLDIHRVVPNFVVQGLCPRGDGYGTGGRRLPDEINPVPYLTGTLGMPNAGEPNTGGCQIFMTHLPTPHLDGRYTVFGRVTAGLEVMQRLTIGDTILHARRIP